MDLTIVKGQAWECQLQFVERASMLRSDISFVASGSQIVSTAGDFDLCDFVADYSLAITGSIHNPGPFTVVTVSGSTLVVEEEVIDESEGYLIGIYQEYPIDVSAWEFAGSIRTPVVHGNAPASGSFVFDLASGSPGVVDLSLSAEQSDFLIRDDLTYVYDLLYEDENGNIGRIDSGVVNVEFPISEF